MKRTLFFLITGIATLFTACTKETVAVSGITLNETVLTLLLGEKETLIATISPENAGNKAFTWSSSNQEVATVSATGEVTAIKRGTATITATTIDGSKTATCTVTAKEIAVYVGGYEQNAAQKSIAKYWRNGIPVILTDGTQNAAINAIEVVGGDVYAAGYEYNVSGKSVAKYWKNGIPVILTDGTQNASIKAIQFFNNNTIYTAGHEYNTSGIPVATYWQNGTPVILKSLDNGAGTYAVAIHFIGDNMYVAGYQLAIGRLRNRAMYWHNGVPFALTDGTTQHYATDIQGVDRDVYVAGYGYNEFGKTVAKYWKNRTPVELTDGLHNAYTSAMQFEMGDIYIAGYEKYAENMSCYWKNGGQFMLPGGSIATAFQILDDNIYAAGNEVIGASKLVAKYWINKTPFTLTDGTQSASASAMYVVVE